MTYAMKAKFWMHDWEFNKAYIMSIPNNHMNPRESLFDKSLELITGVVNMNLENEMKIVAKLEISHAEVAFDQNE